MKWTTTAIPYLGMSCQELYFHSSMYLNVVTVKVPRNRPEGPEGDRGIALLFLDLGTRRDWWSAPRPRRFTTGKDPVPIVCVP
jgi:hypothetical protein